MARRTTGERPIKITHTLLGTARVAEDFERLGEFPWSRLDVAGVPMPIYVCFGETPEGRTVLVGLMLSPGVNREILARHLRQLPLSRLLLPSKVWLLSGRLKQTEARGAHAHNRPGPNGWPRAHYVDVAAAYRRALKTHPRTPVRALMTHFGVSEATIHRWLNRCIKEDLLA